MCLLLSVILTNFPQPHLGPLHCLPNKLHLFLPIISDEYLGGHFYRTLPKSMYCLKVICKRKKNKTCHTHLNLNVNKVVM